MRENLFLISAKRTTGNYIIRYKEGSIPSIMEEYDGIPEKGMEEKGKRSSSMELDIKSMNSML